MSIETIFNPDSLESYIESKVNDAVARAMENVTSTNNDKSNEPVIIRGIKGLAEFLKVTPPTAQKYKNTKGFPYRQIGRVVVFRSDEVLTWIEKRNRRKIV